VVPPEGLVGFLHALPVSRLWGVGAVTQEKLKSLGLSTIGDVARFPEATLARHLGAAAGAHIAALARGEDPRAVEPESAPVSIGHEQTFDDDLDDKETIASVMLSQADRVAARLRSAGLRTRTVMIKVKYTDFQLVSRRRTLDEPTSDGSVIGRVAASLLATVDIGRRHRIRHCGVAATNLEARDAPRQLGFGEQARARGERLGDLLDQIHAKFGGSAISRAVHLDEADGDADDDDE
jgi:DNA polymerase-4